MVFEFSYFEDCIIEKLKKEDLIERFIQTEYKVSPDIKIINDAFEYPSLFFIDDRGLFFLNENEDKIYPNELFTSIDEKGIWLSDKLPDISFDIEQGGNMRMGNEAEALYCLVCVANILNEKGVFKKEVKDIVSDYSFNTMTSNVDGKSFRGLLNEWLNLQSVIINIIISACKFKISDKKKDIEKFLRDGISDMEVIELRNIDSKIKSINYAFSEGAFSSSNIKNLSKIEKLQLIDRRDNEISEVIKKNSCGILYRLLNLSTEYISPIKKKLISSWVRHEVDSEINCSPNKEKFLSERSQLIARLQRRVLKIEKYSVRRIHIEKYINDRSAFIFPSKL